MYFSTISSYDDDQNTQIAYDEKCLICWETATNCNNLIKMNSLHLFSSYYKSCDCNCIIHSHCLLEWINNPYRHVAFVALVFLIQVFLQLLLR